MSKIFDWDEDWSWIEPEESLEELDLKFWEKIQPIRGQSSFFSPENNFLEEKENNFSYFSDSFEDIIFKNPAYTVKEIEHLNFMGNLMDDDLPPHMLREMFEDG